jgi:hypothetical protein
VLQLAAAAPPLELAPPVELAPPLAGSHTIWMQAAPIAVHRLQLALQQY